MCVYLKFLFFHSNKNEQGDKVTLKTNWIEQGDCLELLSQVPDKSVDMILCDLPYGTTQCKWDSIIPLKDYAYSASDKSKFYYEEEYLFFQMKNNGMTYQEAKTCWEANKKTGLWSHYNRIIKDNGTILLFAQTPFDKTLGCSNPEMLRYEWIWEKTQATGHLNAKKMPMKAHENILVFYKNLPIYHPQMTEGHAPVHSYTKYVSTQNATEIYGETKTEVSGGGNTSRYPRSVLTFSSDKQTSHLHPTQKPVALCEYLIQTYTNPGDIILDNCFGSGTTLVAALNLDRKYVGFEKEIKYFHIAKKRIRKAKKEKQNAKRSRKTA